MQDVFLNLRVSASPRGIIPGETTLRAIFNRKERKSVHKSRTKNACTTLVKLTTFLAVKNARRLFFSI